MIARYVDERHIARGYDPYNSADQPHQLMAARSFRMGQASDTVCVSMPKKTLEAFAMFLSEKSAARDADTDEKMRRGFQHLARHGYEFFPGTAERRKFP